MSQQLGPTYLLSLLIVVGSAVAFYRAEKPTTPAPPRVGRGETVESGPTADARAAPPAAEPTRTPLVETSPTPPVRAEPKPMAAIEPRTSRVAPPARRQEPRGQTTNRGAFARTEDGETLEDVAMRIYGTRDKTEALWKANRDQLPAPDSPIAPGMLLRTP